MIKLCLTTLIIALIAPFAQASSDRHAHNDAHNYFGIAMHGTPKYTQETIHLDYANPNAPKGGTLKHAARGTFDSVNPFALKGKAAEGMHLAYDRLMRRVWDEPFSLYPLIARHVEIPQDRSSITIHVDPRARFNDGSSITADDVLFTYETLKTQGRPNMRRVYTLIKSAEKLDTLTLRFVFGEGYDQETAMIMAMMPVLSKKYWEKQYWGKKNEAKREFDSATLEPPVSSGPYKIKSVDVGKRIVYERDPDYWAKDLMVNIGHHNFDTIIYEYYRDDTVALEAFLKGNIDLRRETDSAKWSIFYQDYPQLIKTSFPHGRPIQIQSFIFNTRRPPFDDIRVRKALNLAFDAQWINENIYHGQKKRITSFFENSELKAPASPDTWSPLSPKTMRENLREASRLLSEAGWKTVDGVRTHNETATPFSFEIIVQTTDHEKIALNFIAPLKRLGIKATLRALDSAAFTDRLNGYSYDMIAYHWTSSLSPGTEQYQYWSCEAAQQEMRWNFAGICDKKIDSLVKHIPETRSREALVSSVQALDQRLLNHVLTIPLFYTPTDNYLYRASLHHPKITPLYGTVLETWWKDTQ